MNTTPEQPDHATGQDAGHAHEEDLELGAWMRDWRLTACNHTEVRADEDLICCSPCLRDRLLSSTWLAAHDAAMRERIAVELEEMARPWGDDLAWLTTGTKVAGIAAQVVRSGGDQ